MATVVIGWILLALCVGLLAGKRGRGSGSWFVLSLLLSPLIGVAMLFAARDLSGNVPTPKTHRACPACAEQVLREAIKCKHCGSDLAPEPYHETMLDKLTKMR